jgi:hypothetical protein
MTISITAEELKSLENYLLDQPAKFSNPIIEFLKAKISQSKNEGGVKEPIDTSDETFSPIVSDDTINQD